MKPTSLRLRSGTPDTLRGLTLVSMMAYHACWDLVYLYRMPWDWHRSFWAYAWQQSICFTFILLSGYCWQMGRHPLRRGLMSFFGGAAVSLATLLVLPETPVQFGVLTFLGSAALLTIPLRPLLSRIPPRPGLALSFALFLVLWDVNKGFLGLAGVPLLYLPRNWYANTLSAGLGFPAPSFVSSDYFPLLPWLFLFWAGFYLYRLRPETPAVPDIRLPGIGAIGRRSLMVYLLHQPVIYGLLALIFSLQEVHLCLS